MILVDDDVSGINWCEQNLWNASVRELRMEAEFEERERVRIESCIMSLILFPPLKDFVFSSILQGLRSLRGLPFCNSWKSCTLGVSSISVYDYLSDTDIDILAHNVKLTSRNSSEAQDKENRFQGWIQLNFGVVCCITLAIRSAFCPYALLELIKTLWRKDSRWPYDEAQDEIYLYVDRHLIPGNGCVNLEHILSFISYTVGIS
jgi:hypothetical protein